MCWVLSYHWPDVGIRICFPFSPNRTETNPLQKIENIIAGLQRSLLERILANKAYLLDFYIALIKTVEPTSTYELSASNVHFPT